MYPEIFGFIPTYGLMIIIGVIIALILVVFYLKKEGINGNSIIDLLITSIVAIIVGILFAILFDNLYKTIKYGASWKWGVSMTFQGGLFGGVIGFMAMYFLFYKRKNAPILDKILRIAPAAITSAHSFGRIGCFFAGCCYGVETDCCIGVMFPDSLVKVIPTQLIEAIFLMILAVILAIFAFKKVTNYTMNIYLVSYGIFRFVLEFYRDDERGQLSFLSPGQIWSIIMVISGIVLYFIFKKYLFEGKKI